MLFQNKLKLDTEQASNYAFALMNYKLAQGVESWDWNKDKNCPKHPQNQYMSCWIWIKRFIMREWHL